MEKMGRMIVRLRIPILILALILVVPSVLGFLNTRVNYDILSYLPKDIDTMKGQDIMLDEFGKGGFAFVVLEGMDDNDAASLKAQFEEIDAVENVLWYNSIADASIPKEVLPENIYDIFNSDSSTLMAVFFGTTSSDDAALDAVSEMRRIAGKQCFISGMSAVVEDIKELTMNEMAMYVIIAAVLNFIVLSITMDSFLIPLFFLSSVGLAIIYNLGTNFLQGQISFITLALAAVLQLAVTMDYSVFLRESYKEQRQIFNDKYEAMAAAIGKTFTSVVSSSVTTVAGFLALCFMTFTLGLDLGIVMAKGVIIGVICCVTVLPSMLLVFDKPITKTEHRDLIPSLDGIAGFIIKHHEAFAVLFLALLIPAAYGETHTSVYYNLTSTLPEDLNSVAASSILEDEYGMATQHILMLDADLPENKVREMADKLGSVEGVTKTVGFDTLIGSAIPGEAVPDSVSEIMKSGKWQLMLVGSEFEVASPEINEQISEISEIVKSYDKGGMVIGESAATKDLIEITDRDFKIVNVMSIAFVFIIILIALKSISLPVILVSVIEFAVLVNMGLSCYMHTTIPFIASVVIGTIQLGATVDYAILMTTRYKAERIAGKDKREAVSTALKTSVKSILVSALGFFAATFGVGVYSSVDMISQLCTLLSRGAIVSMLTVNLVLPAMLMLFDRVITATTLDMRHIAGRKKQRSARTDSSTLGAAV